MRSKWAVSSIAALGLLTAAIEPFRPALPGYRYQFPADYFNHPEYRTEWWYYTGNLHSADGRQFGFELTFFRQGIDREKQPHSNVWDAPDVWLAHLALSDIDGHQFLHTERLNRSGPGIAGASQTQARVWNGNWQVQWSGDSEQLQAVSERFGFALTLRPDKPPVIHGINGVSQKSAGEGHASHYFSQTRLEARGKISLDGKEVAVEGLSWMDHEFFTHQMSPNQAGWDWFSLQLDDGSELMLYRLRLKDGSADPYSSGTYVDPEGRAKHLARTDFTLVPGKTWTSSITHGKYPVEWTIRVPSMGADLALRTSLPEQELTGQTKTSPAYWEGAIRIQGTKHAHAVQGAGYLEMTGYAGPINFGG